MSLLPNTPAHTDDDQDAEMLSEFRAFRASLYDEGFFTPSPLHVMYRILELCVMFLFGCYLIPVSITLSVITFSLFGTRCGWVHHEGGHGSLTGNLKTDKLIQDLTIGFGLLTDGSMWNLMHNKHHATPQKINHDMDIDTTPLVAFFDTAIEKNRTQIWSGRWLRFQAYTFLPITIGFVVMLFWVFYLHPRKIIRDRNWRQVAIVMSGHIVRTLMFMWLGGYTLAQSYGLLMLCMWASSMYLFGHFSLSHTFTDVVDEHGHKNWVRFAIEHSVDIVPNNPLVNWVMGYLNCQVIHHLFPQMPQFRQPEVSRRLKVFCEKWNIRYTVLGYFEAWRMMLQNLDSVGRHYAKEKAM